MPGPGQSVGREKVFCNKCHWLYNEPMTANYQCTHPNNRNNKKDTWLSKGTAGHRPPHIINKKNKCGWYEVKGSRYGRGKKLA